MLDLSPRTRKQKYISDEAIKAAGETQKLSGIEGFTFTAGGAEELQAIADSAFDGVILSNIIDNLLPEDAIVVLAKSGAFLSQAEKYW